MNVTCTGCPAKYAVPDEKVRGKKVRITCKHCGANIVVDGSALGSEARARCAQRDRHATCRYRARPKQRTDSYRGAEPRATQPSEPEPETDRARAGNDRAPGEACVHRRLPRRSSGDSTRCLEIAAMYRAGQDRRRSAGLEGRHDGLALTLRGSESAAVLEKRRGGRANCAELRASRAHRRRADAHGVARPLEAHRSGSLPAAGAALPEPCPARRPFQALSASPHAGRQAERRRAAQRTAGGRWICSAPLPKPAVSGMPRSSSATREDSAHKLTGARNESSVLFSLDALTKRRGRQKQKQKVRDEEAEKQASRALFGDDAPILAEPWRGGLAALSARGLLQSRSPRSIPSPLGPCNTPAPRHQATRRSRALVGARRASPRSPRSATC